ncbi:eukaryotic translation elongation factor 1 epsilon-1 isoform X3 [Pteropus alecto]|uniref:eukaryotic translation elongation factor 1 epsilon-1 isoform X3 n=1 Tax=Pteropus alecto TaxID=9402 RepID=UPI0007688E9E|nr:eukaryotic translation elongation factor 1 epsilon-1 isoform X3 [Pteropus alecto]
MAAAATTELMLLEKSLGLSKGNKYSAQGERQDLNSYLEDKVYLTGYNFTLADILLYYGLHRFIFRAPMEVCHSFRKKEKVKEKAEQSRTTSHKACPRGSMVPIGKVANHHFTLIWNGSLQVFLTCLHGELVTKNIICLALKFKLVIECQ